MTLEQMTGEQMLEDNMLTPMPEDRRKIRLLYIGYRVNAEGKLVQAFVDIDNEGNIDPNLRERHYLLGRIKTPMKLSAPGSIWEVEAGGGSANTIFPGTARAVGVYKNRSDVTAWQAESQAIRRTHEAARLREKETSTRLDEEALRGIRRAYMRSTHAVRAQILADVIHFVTTGVKREGVK